MSNHSNRSWLLHPLSGWVAFAVLLVAVYIFSCGPRPGVETRRGGGAATGGAETGSAASAALATYVNPGDLDEYYLFYSGGHSGQIYVAGLPSMRHISTIPVFAPYSATGYGFDDATKKMLGGYTWGDCHHPSLSKTNGEYDGRWLFINENANNRIARVDLRDFKTKQIIGPIPNLSGNHGSAFVTANTECVLYASRFSRPLGHAYASIDEYKTKYKGVVGAVNVDPNSGEMSYGFQIVTPPYDWDLGSTGKGPSADWAFWTCYNSEEGTGQLEKTASQNDRDYVIAVNWKLAEQATSEGKATDVGGIKQLDPAQVPGLAYLIPAPKSPHGVDVTPDGTMFVVSGKLEAVTTVFSYEKMVAAIQAKNFTGTEGGMPVLNYDSVKDKEVQIGNGPLHTQYDDKGYAYTSLFLDSAVAKWKLGGDDPAAYQLIEKIPVQYNIGHISAAEGDTVSPDGKYLVALNKWAVDRFLPVGPLLPQNEQLVDISGNPMKVIYDMPMGIGEPHYAQMIKADKIKPWDIYPQVGWDSATQSPSKYATKLGEEKIVRDGSNVEVFMTSVRSHLTPDRVELKKGDHVSWHITNVETAHDATHGFQLGGQGVSLSIEPGETVTFEFDALHDGTYAFYCTEFCSALHLEMMGYMTVEP